MLKRSAFTVLLAAVAAALVATSQRGAAAPASVRGTPPAWVGHTVLLHPRTKTSGCRRGVLPDRRCSPGAFYSGLTKARLCSSTFRTSTIRDVSEDKKHAVEVEYRMAPRAYGRTLEIDHIVSLELGGSNDIANLFPEPGSGGANFHRKDALENAVHDAVCKGTITLRAAQRAIASNWMTLYQRMFGRKP